MITYKFYNSLCTDAMNIRETVFIKEQGFQDEFDELDDRSIHLVLYEDNKAVATGRLFPLNTDKSLFKFGRIAVLNEYRKLHLGSKLLQLLDEKAVSMGATVVQLSAQCNAQKFYEKNNYQSVGVPYKDEGCDHILMVKEL